MRQTLSNTKKSLGRVWFRYFQLYGMTSKLAISCINIGWTQVVIDTYSREHYHLVNQFTANMVKDNEPNVPNPGDPEWLTSSPHSSSDWKGAVDTSVCGPKEEESSKIQTRNCGIEGNKKVSEALRITHKTNAISETGKRNSSSS